MKIKQIFRHHLKLSEIVHISFSDNAIEVTFAQGAVITISKQFPDEGGIVCYHKESFERSYLDLLHSWQEYNNANIS